MKNNILMRPGAVTLADLRAIWNGAKDYAAEKGLDLPMVRK